MDVLSVAVWKRRSLVGDLPKWSRHTRDALRGSPGLPWKLLRRAACIERRVKVLLDARLPALIHLERVG